MKNLTLVLVFAAAICSCWSAKTGNNRSKRNLLNFGVMIFTATGRSPLDFNGYGCYCGFGGKGTPLDGIDRCCQMHDTCYSDLKKKGHCKSLEVYLLSYKTTLPLTCAKNNSKCRDGLCECDVSAALCFKTQTFQEKYRKYDRSKCENEVKI
ncbi:acidic phospholipase A2-like isoform X2 [Xenia sp. Carnegie-2017]|uniref:acidic phospholipase A2-like isoform X2 n=1 Tax=Xenia sp. Carnegie-2017 TaxID=2897299 RepID=UPI001F050194|nr:acidic phospholipase A2-like isoform X2 [Xenia sp. Carnegie-2017]